MNFQVTLADVKSKYEQEMKRTAQLEQERSEHEHRLRAVVEKVEKHVDLVVRKNESLEQVSTSCSKLTVGDVMFKLHDELLLTNNSIILLYSEMSFFYDNRIITATDLEK